MTILVLLLMSPKKHCNVSWKLIKFMCMSQLFSGWIYLLIAIGTIILIAPTVVGIIAVPLKLYKSM